MKRLTTEEFIRRAREVHGDKYIYTDVKYINNKTKVCIICPIHGKFWQMPYSHLNGNGCNKCGCEIARQKEASTKEYFINQCIKLYGDKYDLSKVDYVNSQTKVCIICSIHGEFWQTPNNFLHGHGCPKCGIEERVTKSKLGLIEFIRRAREIHGDKYDYSKVEYININVKVCIICPIHGEFWQTPYDHLNNHGCSKCKISKLEKELSDYLNDIENIEIIYEAKFEWLGRQSIDFYLPQYNIGIECQGIQHFKPINFFGGQEQYEYTKKCDAKKKELCDSHHIHLLYYSNLHIDYPYEVYENKEELLKEILKNG